MSLWPKPVPSHGWGLLLALGWTDQVGWPVRDGSRARLDSAE